MKIIKILIEQNFCENEYESIFILVMDGQNVISEKKILTHYSKRFHVNSTYFIYDLEPTNARILTKLSVCITPTLV